VADQLRERFPKIARLIDDTEDDVLAHMGFHGGIGARSTAPTRLSA
jgi:hypothetical protein